MTIRDTYMNRCGTPDEAAAQLARDLMQGDAASFKAGYSRDNAILAARDIFPEVTDVEHLV